jgi:hypothetical protein
MKIFIKEKIIINKVYNKKKGKDIKKKKLFWIGLLINRNSKIIYFHFKILRMEMKVDLMNQWKIKLLNNYKYSNYTLKMLATHWILEQLKMILQAAKFLIANLQAICLIVIKV